mmetsp:Transcript_35714/g.77714  ORF Transcript_35714/g.77714 Transcript_35714/m.77714 type:complete len:208 (-) Transcript_35714:1769-2392(-)
MAAFYSPSATTLMPVFLVATAPQPQQLLEQQLRAMERVAVAALPASPPSPTTVLSDAFRKAEQSIDIKLIAKSAALRQASSPVVALGRPINLAAALRQATGGASANPSSTTKGPLGAKSPCKKKKRVLFPRVTTMILKQWFEEHVTNPYPTDAEKRRLCTQCNLSPKQLKTWLINHRMRSWKPMLAKALATSPAAASATATTTTTLL